MSTKFTNIITVKTSSYEGTINIMKRIQNATNESYLDFNKIKPLENYTNIQERKDAWGLINNAFNVEKPKITMHSLIIKFQTMDASPVKVIKELSLLPEADEIVLSYASENFKEPCGIFYIRGGGIMNQVTFDKDSKEAMDFSTQLIYGENSSKEETELNLPRQW